jgi:hypothetical protein
VADRFFVDLSYGQQLKAQQTGAEKARLTTLGLKLAF